MFPLEAWLQWSAGVGPGGFLLSPRLTSLVPPLGGVDVAVVDGRGGGGEGRFEGAGACQGWTHCRDIRLALLPPNSPSLPHPPALHRGLAGCFGGGPEAHSTIIPMIL